jgi:hypothetical protein
MKDINDQIEAFFEQYEKRFESGLENLSDKRLQKHLQIISLRRVQWA